MPGPCVLYQVGDYYFNGFEMIKTKTRLAAAEGFAGVMIWEVGQDLHPSHRLALLHAITGAHPSSDRAEL